MVRTVAEGFDPPKEGRVRPSPAELRKNILAQAAQQHLRQTRTRAPRGARFWTGLKELIWSLSLAVLAAGGIFTYLTGVDFHHFAPAIEQAIESRTHLKLSMNGPVHVAQPFTRPSVELENLVLSTADKGGEGSAVTLADITKLKLTINPARLFSSNGQMEIDEVSIEGAIIYLYADNNINFILESLIETVKALLDSVPPYFGDGVLREVVVRDSTFIRLSPLGDDIWAVSVSDLRLKVGDTKSPFAAPLEIFWAGELRSRSFTLSGTVTDYLEWLQGGETGFVLEGDTDGARLVLTGIATGLAQPVFDLDFQISGDEREPTDAADTQPGRDGLHIYGQVRGRLMEAVSGAWTGANAGGPVEGRFSLGLGERPSLSLEASSGVLDAAFAMSAVQIISAYVQNDRRTPFKLIPNTEMHVHLQTDQMRLNAQTLGPAEFDLSLADAVLTARAQQETWEGEITAVLSVNGKETPVFNLFLSAMNVNPTRLAPSSEEETPGGAIWIDAPLLAWVDLLSHGQDQDALVQNLSGEAALVLGGGTFDQALLDLMPAPVAGLASDEAGLPAFKCLIARVDVDRGHAKSKMLWAETLNGMITGSGSIDIPAGTVEMIVRPRPKDPRALAGAVDLVISGPLFAPTLETRQKDLARGLASGFGRFAARGQVDAVLPLLEEHLPQDNSCLEAWTGSVNNGEG